MSRTEQTAGEVQARPYVAKLVSLVGVKGLVLLAGLVAMAALASAYSTVEATMPGATPLAVTSGVVLTLALGFSVAVDRALWPETGVDWPGVSMVLIATVFTVMVSLGFVPSWRFALFSSFFLFASVAADYVYKSSPGLRFGEAELDPGDSDELTNLDVVGFVFSELLLVYAIVVYAGWSSFAHHPVFPSLAFVLISTFFAVVAGYRVVRERVFVTPDTDFNEVLVGLVRETKDVDDDVLRRDIAAKLRSMGEALSGVTLPTEIRDKYGGVPVVLPDDDPDAVVEACGVEELLDGASRRRHTGYALHGDDVHLFRNGTLVNSFVGGEYTDEPSNVREARAQLFETTHAVVNQLEAVLPKTGRERVEPEPETVESEKATTTKDDQVIQVGGQEVDIDEMFRRADDIIEDLSKRGGQP